MPHVARHQHSLEMRTVRHRLSSLARLPGRRATDMVPHFIKRLDFRRLKEKQVSYRWTHTPTPKILRPPWIDLSETPFACFYGAACRRSTVPTLVLRPGLRLRSLRNLEILAACCCQHKPNRRYSKQDTYSPLHRAMASPSKACRGGSAKSITGASVAERTKHKQNQESVLLTPRNCT